MLLIQHNLLAQNASRQLNTSIGKNAKTTEKLSSGYRINRAADDAAGLAISEKMRRQIRGLTQATANAKDGISYVQTADGAMEEVHSILQRMNELSIKSLNGTLTESDRAALNEEFDHLRAEIDRINHDTEFNNQKVFEEHEPSYYQIEGSIKWDNNQLHTISSAANELIINLPDSYAPSSYTITVPAGVYTTQELADEIDDALSAMTPPNPGFVIEYTEKGYFNLNFESASGMPTALSSIDGSLAYLFYNSYGGSSTGDLLGTTEFGEDPLTIYKGYNDILGFYVESTKGTEYISITIPAGSYIRDEMIEKINSLLKTSSVADVVKADVYGDSNIMITGGQGVNITGLKGNMFKYENDTAQYSSVFYDNAQYGVSSSTCALITGMAYYDDSTTAKIKIVSGENDTLSIKLNEADGFKKVKIPVGEYTIEGLAKKLKELFSIAELSKEILVTTLSNSSVGSYLRLSSTLYGSKSLLEFDTTPGSVYANTYDSLFRITRYLPVEVEAENAVLTGKSSISTPITLSQDASLSFYVDGKLCSISGFGGTYGNLGDLVDVLTEKLERYISDHCPELQDKVKFDSDSGRLTIAAQTGEISKINFAEADRNSTYIQLFTSKSESVKMTYNDYSANAGSIKYVQQGSTANVKTSAELKVAIPASKQSTPITIDESSCRLSFLISTSTSTRTYAIDLDAKTYNNMFDLVDEINKKLAESDKEELRNITAKYDGGKLIFTSPPLDNTYTIEPYNYTSTSSIWKNIFGTKESISHPADGARKKATVTAGAAFTESITIDENNNMLTLNIGSGDSISVNIESRTYTSVEDLREAVGNAINAEPVLKDKIVVSITSGKLQLSTDEAVLEVSGSFYDDVLTTKVTRDIPNSNYRQNGTYNSYKEAFIIGRKDLTEDPIEIIAAANDVFTFDFTYNSAETSGSNYTKTISITIPPGTYSGDEIAEILKVKIRDEFNRIGLSDFEIDVTVGGESTNVANANDDTALHIIVKRNGEPACGEYILDSVRGSAANFLFYKTTTDPKATYLTGTKDLAGGVTFQSEKNVFTFVTDSTTYQYTFPENTSYTTEEFLNLFNNMLENGDDNGNIAPVTASIENGVLKLTHNLIGSHVISDIGGSARSTIFYNESGRDFRNPLCILVGCEAGDTIEIPRTSVSSCSLGINSITLSKSKYAEKAVRRIKEAINLVSSRRSTYGAIQNRLEHTVNNNNNVIENTQASESAIRDADIADMMMEYSVNNILMQAGTSMLAQANQSSRLILELLQ